MVWNGASSRSKESPARSSRGPSEISGRWPPATAEGTRRLVDPDAEGIDLRTLSLQLERIGLGVGIGTSQGAERGRAHDDLAAASRGLEPGGRIRDVPDRREVLEASPTDVAHVLLAAADPHPDVDPARSGAVAEAAKKRLSSRDRMLRIAGPRQPRHEYRHDLVSGDLAEHRVVREQGLGGSLVEAVQEDGRFEAGQPLGDRRVAAHVRE